MVQRDERTTSKNWWDKESPCHNSSPDTPQVLLMWWVVVGDSGQSQWTSQWRAAAVFTHSLLNLTSAPFTVKWLRWLFSVRLNQCCEGQQQFSVCVSALMKRPWRLSVCEDNEVKEVNKCISWAVSKKFFWAFHQNWFWNIFTVSGGEIAEFSIEYGHNAT